VGEGWGVDGGGGEGKGYGKGGRRSGKGREDIRTWRWSNLRALHIHASALALPTSGASRFLDCAVDDLVQGLVGGRGVAGRGIRAAFLGATWVFGARFGNAEAGACAVLLGGRADLVETLGDGAGGGALEVVG